jgi:hypothetical protein
LANGSDTKDTANATMNLPLITVRFELREVRIPQPRLPRSVRLPKIGRREINSAATKLRSSLPDIPDARHGLYYGGLALTVAFGVIEWPVVAAIGVGTALVERSGSSTIRRREPSSAAH